MKDDEVISRILLKDSLSYKAVSYNADQSVEEASSGCILTLGKFLIFSGGTLIHKGWKYVI